MIGQKDLLHTLEERIKDNKFPRFSILVGPPRSGKKEVLAEIHKLFNKYKPYKDFIYEYRLPDNKVETVRKMIDEAYNNPSIAIYTIADADGMSGAARNALLKLTEEPPNNAYIIMTVSSLGNVLPTIQSRGTVFYMNNYSPNEIDDFVEDNIENDEDKAIAKTICALPGEVLEINTYNIIEFYEYVQRVFENIGLVSDANAFKIAGKVKLKDTDEGYDLTIFWKTFISICSENLIENPILVSKLIKCTIKKLQELKITGVNKLHTFDTWILEVRECYT